MNVLKTKNHAFECDYCLPFAGGGKKQLFVRVPSKDKLPAVAAFDDPDELTGLEYCGQPLPGYSRLASFANEGALTFFILEA